MSNSRIVIEDLSHDGRGVARSPEGKALFIPGALPGEVVSLSRYRRRRHYDEAWTEAILEKAPDRVEPFCPHFGTCGGCNLQHLAPESQVRHKQTAFLRTLRRIGDVSPDEVLPPIVGPVRGYRRRARLGVRFVARKNRILVGFRERGGRYVTDTGSCPVLMPPADELIQPLATLVQELDVFDRIPQIELAIGDDNCGLIFRSLEQLSQRDHSVLTRFLEHHHLRGYVQSGSRDSIEPLNGEYLLYYELPEFALRFGFGPADFIQVNGPVNRSLTWEAVKLLGMGQGASVLELFSGLGNFSLPLARDGAIVTAVEGDPVLVKRARENARANRIETVQVFQSDLFSPSDRASWLHRRHYHGALLDPPRDGAKAIIPYLPKLGIERLVYVSCHPATLARDAAELKQVGYALRAAGVADMFPQTSHVETMALFQRTR